MDLYQPEELKIKIKYFNIESKPLSFIESGDWIDLYANEDVTLKPFEYHKIRLGVAMQLPEGYEANVVARSSTFEKWGIIQTNAYGVIDESYCGDRDEWKFPVLALRETSIYIGDKIAQFRINKKMSRNIIFKAVPLLGNSNRGGFGSTGNR